MADKSIDQLVAADSILPSDLLVLQQSNMAKKLPGQVLLNWLTAAADGHGGINSIQKVSTSVLVDTYRITLADTTTFDFNVNNGRAIISVVQTSVNGLTRTYTINFNDDTTQSFQVTDGRSIVRVEKIGTNDLVDTYRIYYNDNITSDFSVTNGAKGDKGDNAYTWIKYASQQPTSAAPFFGDVPDNWIGFYYGPSDVAPNDWQQYSWFEIKGKQGDPGAPATLQNYAVEYQVSDSGTVIPSGAWSTSVPVVAQGKYLWTRTTQNYNTGSPVTSYSVSRMGIDGTGSVVSVAGVSPDADGNVTLTAEDVGALSNTGGDLTGELRMNGQPISGLNVPTANDHAANMGFVTQQVKKASPRNLLDNSDFRNPVNQRGKDVYSNAEYTIDRWKSDIGGIDISVEDGCVSLFSAGVYNFTQVVGDYKPLKGKTATFALRYGGDITLVIGYYANGAMQYINAESVNGLAIGTIVIPDNVESITFFIQTKAQIKASLYWAALYEGEYTIDTLPEYQPKGYGAELAECQRYANVLEVSVYGRVGLCKSSAGEAASILFVDTPVMRSGAVPSVSLISGSLSDLRTEFGDQNVTSITGFAYQIGTKHNLLVNLSGNNPTQIIEPIINTSVNVVKLLISMDL